MSMTNRELIAELADREGLTKVKAKKVLKTVIAIIRGEVQAEGRMAVADLGVFKLREHRAMKAVTPKGTFNIQARKHVLFQMGSGWKKAVNLK